MKVVAIHQPNFFPWLGYFHKIAHSDAFIFLDDVQYQKTGGTWSNRVQLLISGEPKWATAPLDRNHHGVRNINEIHFQSNKAWRVRLKRSIELNYGKHPFFTETMALLEPHLGAEETKVSAFNIAVVSAICAELGFDSSRLHLSSDLTKQGHSNELLSTLTLAVGGDVYLCGAGAGGYQDQAVFGAHGIALQYQDFRHPIYLQANRREFIPGLSIIDALMNLGTNGTRTVLAQR